MIDISKNQIATLPTFAPIANYPSPAHGHLPQSPTLLYDQARELIHVVNDGCPRPQ